MVLVQPPRFLRRSCWQTDSSRALVSWPVFWPSPLFTLLVLVGLRWHLSLPSLLHFVLCRCSGFQGLPTPLGRACSMLFHQKSETRCARLSAVYLSRRAHLSRAASSLLVNKHLRPNNFISSVSSPRPAALILFIRRVADITSPSSMLCAPVVRTSFTVKSSLLVVSIRTVPPFKLCSTDCTRLIPWFDVSPLKF